MKFTFLTYGTEGDTRPLVAIAKGLIQQGHQAQLLADVSTADHARAQGVPFIALAGSMKDTVLPEGALSQIMRDGGDVACVARACAKIAQDNTASWMAATREVAAQGDILVFSGLAAYAGLAVAEGLDQPCIGAGLWPMTPTREFACAFMRPRPLPGWANLLSHRFFNGLSWQLFRASLNEGRQKVFGKPARRRMWQGYPVLYGCSPTLVPRPADWPANIALCGAWHLPQPEWQPPEVLSTFLAQGEPPVYVGFGSMGGFDRRQVLSAIVEAVGARRALFYPGWSGIDPALLPANFHVLGDTPHDWLFPRTSLIIHHGGAGTSHAAARSGVPSVVVPFAGDQFFWADRLVQAGIASASPLAGKLDGAQLQRLMVQASMPAVHQKARAVAAAIRLEDGCRVAQEKLLGGMAMRLA